MMAQKNGRWLWDCLDALSSYVVATGPKTHASAIASMSIIPVIHRHNRRGQPPGDADQLEECFIAVVLQQILDRLFVDSNAIAPRTVRQHCRWPS